MSEQSAESGEPPNEPQAQSKDLPKPLMFKNRLQEYTQRSAINMPVYNTINEGFPHAPRFRACVLVDGVCYTSPNTFSLRKAAEQDVARVALDSITEKIKDEGCPIIYKDTVFCKSILNEYAVKMNLGQPTYSMIKKEGLLPHFVSSVVFNGVTYSGEAARNKKEADRLAARAVILSILGNSDSGTVMSEIIKSKSRLYDALYEIGSQNMPVAVNTKMSLGSPLGKGKEIDVSACTNKIPSTASQEALLSQLNNILATHQPHHQFKQPKRKLSPETITPPVVFVPLAPEQPEQPGNSDSGTVMSEIIKSKSRLYDALYEIGSQNMPVAVNTEMSLGSPLGKGKEIDVSACTNKIPSTASQEALLSRLNNILATHQPYHQFKQPKRKLSPETITPPVVFVPPAPEQPEQPGSSSSARKRKKRKKKKKADNRVQVNAQFPVAMEPFGQIPPCSSETITPPVVFVPPALEQPEQPGSRSSARKHKKRKKKKKADNGV